MSEEEFVKSNQAAQQVDSESLARSYRCASRREFLKTGLSTLGSLALTESGLAAGMPESTSSSHVDNVILIVSDTMRRDALSLYGGNWIPTPHIDRFAREAIVFEKCFISSFPTVLLRNDLITGRYTFTYKPWSPLDDDAVTLQATLNKGGILTALIADTPHPFAPRYDYQRGFQAWQLNRGQEGDPYRSSPRYVKLPCDPSKLRGGARTVTQYLRNVSQRRSEEDYFAPETMIRAAKWLAENHDGRRFFLYVDTFDPHEPWDPPHYYAEPFNPGYRGDEVIYAHYDYWQKVLSPAELKECRALYAGEVCMVDRWVGFLLDRVRTLGLLKNTAIVFVGDHGHYLGEHGYIGKLLVREGMFQYFPLYPELCRVPLLIYYPECQGGTHTDALAQPVDIPATVLDLLGVPKPPSMDGVSLVPLLEGRNKSVNEIAISSPVLYFDRKKEPIAGLAFDGPDPSARSSITDGEWLLVYGAQIDSSDLPALPKNVASRAEDVRSIQGTVTPELYHLAEDTACLRNLVRDKHDVAKRLHAAYVEFLENHGIPESRLRYYQSI